MNALGLAPSVRLVGHDIGGMVAFAYARTHPEEVERLVLLELAVPGLGLEQAMDVAHGGRWQPAELDSVIAAYSGRRSLNAGFGHYRTLLNDGATNRAWLDAGGRLRMPVLAVGGEHGVGGSLADALREAAPSLRSAVVAGSGHFVPEEAPEELLAEREPFLA